MEQREAFGIIQAYLDVHRKLPSGLKSEGLLPYSKEVIPEALRTSLSRVDRSSLDDDLIRGAYLRLSEYQPNAEEILRTRMAEEQARYREELRAFPEKPIPEEMRRKMLELFPPREEMHA